MGEHVYVRVNVAGYAWTAFERVTVSYSAKQAVRQFAFTATDDTGSGGLLKEAWNFMPDTPVTVTANGHLLVTGYIEHLAPSYDGNHHVVEVSGRSKGADAVDSSAEHKTGEFKKKTPLQIAQELDKYGIGFKARAKNMKPIEIFRLNPGESMFACVDRACRKQQLRLQGEPDGSILLTDDCAGSNAPLIEGVNILKAGSTFDNSERHSEYRVRGQKAYGTDKKLFRIEGTSKDGGVKRHRPRIIRPETDLTEEEAKKRAEHLRDRQMGESITATVTTQGWHDDNGRPWLAGGFVYVYSPMLKLDMTLAISTVSLTQDASGSVSVLSLVHPAALGSSKSTGSKTAPEYQPGFEAPPDTGTAYA